MDLGLPISYKVLTEGTPVYSAEGEEIGKVTHTLAAEDLDIFEGLIIGEHRFGSGHRFVDAEDIEEMHEHGVQLLLGRADCEKLPEPSANPGVIREDPTESKADKRHERLMRAWDRISGNY